MTIKRKIKAFSQKLHDDNDPDSREVVKKFYKKKYNINLTDNPDKRKKDLITEDGKFLEIEHRLIWKTPKFPYEQINFPFRKGNHYSKQAFDYVILSLDYSHIGIITAEKLGNYIKEEHLKEVSNKHIRSGEFFYKLNASDFEWYKL